MTPPTTNTTPRQIAVLAKAVKEKLEGVIDECESIELEPVHEALELATLLADLAQQYRLSERRDATRPNP
jgi:hypothetical protein